MPKALIIVLLIVASFLIVGIIAGKKIYKYMENASEHAKLKEGVELTKQLNMIAHRGLSAVAPENSISAFKLAAQAGFKYIETDVHRTKDGYWVVMHDPTVDRMTDGTGAIADLTLEEIKKLKITRGSGIEKYDNEGVPTFKEYVDVVTSGGSYPVIEVKAKGEFDFKDLVYTLKEYNITDKAVVIDYDIDQLRTIRKLCPELQMQILGHVAKNKFIKAAEELGNCGLDIMHNLQTDNRTMKKIREKGLPINFWTVDNEKTLEKIYKMGASYATTNTLAPVVSQKDDFAPIASADEVFE